MSKLLSILLFVALATATVKGNHARVFDIVVRSDTNNGVSCGCEHEIPVFKLRCGEHAYWSAKVQYDAAIKDAWYSLEWSNGFFSAERSHFCFTCKQSLEIGHKCDHSNIEAGTYLWKEYKFTVPQLECNKRYYLRVVFYADWKCGEKTYDVVQEGVAIDIVC